MSIPVPGPGPDDTGPANTGPANTGPANTGPANTGPANPETIFTYGAPQLKFGPGASDEIGFDLSQYGVRRALVVTDPGVAATGIPQRVADQMTRFAGSRPRSSTGCGRADGREHERRGRPGPSGRALGRVRRRRRRARGSTRRRPSHCSLSNPGDLMDYVNAPIGGGRAPSAPLMPLVAVPTTTGTGSGEHDDLRARRALAAGQDRHQPFPAATCPRRRRPRCSPSRSRAGVTAASGMDILCHALESYTARRYTSYEHKQPRQRVPYCGANPISDMWSEKALGLLAGSFRARGRHGDDVRPGRIWPSRPRSPGWGSATRACTSRTPTLTRSRAGSADFRPVGYPAGEPLVPHGMSVALTAPEAFRFTFAAAPGAAPAGRPAARPRRGAVVGRPRSCSPGADRPDARHRDPERAWPRSATAPPTSTRWWRAR